MPDNGKLRSLKDTENNVVPARTSPWFVLECEMQCESSTKVREVTFWTHSGVTERLVIAVFDSELAD